jgi:hypothetical protein
MKVRHKQSRKDAFQYWDVIEESQNFYIVRNGLYKPGEEQRLVLFSKNDYEPVPTETWRDVTGECNITHDKWPPEKQFGEGIAHNGMVLYEPTHWVPQDGYRLRKVHLLKHVYPGGCQTGQDAFIIEKKET